MKLKYVLMIIMVLVVGLASAQLARYNVDSAWDGVNIYYLNVNKELDCPKGIFPDGIIKIDRVISEKEAQEWKARFQRMCDPPPERPPVPARVNKTI